MSESILDLDLGNTRLKWRYSAPGQVVEQGGLPYGEGGELPPVPSPARIRVASVVGSERLDKVLQACRGRWQVNAEVARVQENCAGVRQGYEDKSRLGVDRWLALLAAHRAVAGHCLVVSCGTAVTVDLLTAAGEHLGGYIVPGFEMMRGALFAGTNAVKLDKINPPEDLAPGRDTLPAVTHGLVLMVSSLVESAASRLKGGTGGVTVMVTGGDGEVLAPFLGGASTNVLYRPNLVLDGLALALP